MNRLLNMFALAGLLLLIGCTVTTTNGTNSSDKDAPAAAEPERSSEPDNDAVRPDGGKPEMPGNSPDSGGWAGEPKTVMDFFALLPAKYFTLEGCYPDQDKGCRKARAEYLKSFSEVEDTKNGYFKGGCDGGQSCIEMALFKRSDNTYVIALATLSEMMEDNYFLDYKEGVWFDVSKTIVPEFRKDKRYEIPRFGTTIKVFSTKLIEKGDDYEIREKDQRIYDLEWKDGRFVKMK